LFERFYYNPVYPIDDPICSFEPSEQRMKFSVSRICFEGKIRIVHRTFALPGE